MGEPDLKTIAADGFADAMRRSPVVYAVVLEAFAIAILAGWMISDSRAERRESAEYIQSLHAELVDCHKHGPPTRR